MRARVEVTSGGNIHIYSIGNSYGFTIHPEEARELTDGLVAALTKIKEMESQFGKWWAQFPVLSDAYPSLRLVAGQYIDEAGARAAFEAGISTGKGHR